MNVGVSAIICCSAGLPPCTTPGGAPESFSLWVQDDWPPLELCCTTALSTGIIQESTVAQRRDGKSWPWESSQGAHLVEASLSMSLHF